MNWRMKGWWRLGNLENVADRYANALVKGYGFYEVQQININPSLLEQVIRVSKNETSIQGDSKVQVRQNLNISFFQVYSHTCRVL